MSVSVESRAFESSRQHLVSVAMHIRDERVAADVVPGLLISQQLEVVPAQESAGADVVLALVDVVSDAVVVDLCELSERSENRSQRIVLVAGPLQERHLSQLFGAGVTAILPRRDVTAQQIARAIFACHSGRALLPEKLTRWLVDELRFVQSNLLATKGIGAGGLTVREVEVLKLIARGDDTAAVAAQLSYSERTIKKIMQELMSRLELRNRTHAVSYAMRVGAI